MKRARAPPVELKEVKLEGPDEDQIVSKRPDLTRTSDLLNSMASAIPEKVPKEEPLDDGFLLKEPKLEIPEETVSDNKTPTIIPVWRPKLESITDFLRDDSLKDTDFEMTLGSSMLFDNPRGSFSSLNTYAEEAASNDSDDELSDQKISSLVPTLRAALFKSFNKNPHPTALEMQLIAEDCVTRYKTVVDYFEICRKVQKIKCKKNDPCERIKGFLLMENQIVGYTKVSNERKAMLQEQIQTHLLSRKRFSIGYLHVIMERTDLPPHYIRGQYDAWKKKLLTENPKNFKIQDYQNGFQTNLLSIETLRLLEEAYLNKKYHSENKEWTFEDIEILAESLELSPGDVDHWLNRRKGATLGLENDVIQLRRHADAKQNAAISRKLSAERQDRLNAEYLIKRKPNPTEMDKIAKTLDLDELQVRSWFNRKRAEDKKISDWEKARTEIMTLPDNKKMILERAAGEKKKNAVELTQLSQYIGVAYKTVCNFLEWRKSSTGIKNNRYHN